LRRFPIHPGAIWGLVKEVKAATEDFEPLILAGAAAPARKLERALTAGGDRDAVRLRAGGPLTAYDLEGAGLLVYVLDGEEPGPADEEALRLADRKNVETICLLVGATRTDPIDVPHVLATDVIRVGSDEELPVEEVVERIADRAGDKSYTLAARLPVLRKAVCEAIIRGIARQNGVLGAAIFLPGADLPALTLNQIRMVFRIAAAYGEEIDRERAPELLAVVGAGLGFRAVAREALGLVPGPGWALKGAIAYAGTRALGEAAVAYFEKGGARRLAETVGSSVRSRS
jgi:uncharacterized protein (DUF697 family)